MSQRETKFPLAIVTFYGPDDRSPFKIAVGIIEKAGSEPVVVKRWVGTRVSADPKVKAKIKKFVEGYKVKQIAITDKIIGCPHEEGIDYPKGQDCPFCPFWKGKKVNRFNTKILVIDASAIDFLWKKE